MRRVSARRSTRALLLAGTLLRTGTVLGRGPWAPAVTQTERPDDRLRATLADLRMLVGHWRGAFLGGTGELVWLPPAGGTMVGVFRLYRADAVVFYEILTAVEDQGNVSLRLKHFHSDLKGWEGQDDAVTFRLVRAERDAVWFDGLSYRRFPDGTLRGILDLRSKDGHVREEAFTLKPVTGW